VTVRESEWTEEDRALVLAFIANERGQCPGCGHPVEECRDRATGANWQVFTETCWASRWASKVAEDNAGQAGLYIYTKRTAGVT
jgi:hypothetical protein